MHMQVRIIENQTLIVSESLKITEPSLFKNCTFIIKPPANIDVVNVNITSEGSLPKVLFSSCRFTTLGAPLHNITSADDYSLISIAESTMLTNCTFENIQLPENASLISIHLHPLYSNSYLSQLIMDDCKFNLITTGSFIKLYSSAILLWTNSAITNTTVYRSLIDKGFMQRDGTQTVHISYILGQIKDLTIDNSRLLTLDSDEEDSRIRNWLVADSYIFALKPLQTSDITIKRSYINQFDIIRHKNSIRFHPLHITSSYIRRFSAPYSLDDSSIVFNNSFIANLQTNQVLIYNKESNAFESASGNYYFHRCYIANGNSYIKLS